ncbi:MAG TPA: fused MFS/spermidine synthase, partial [Anaerolineales bacterium]|nr:fused MFS/spermidine synthase [Anaerolineales bacterium]
YIPAHMTTQEFFAIVASHLTDNGVLTINSASVPGDRRLINGLATTMGTIFPSIYTVDIPGSLNTMIFATKQKTQPENFAVNLLTLSQDPTVHPLLVSTMQTTFGNLKSGYEVTTVFTDDHAPIEWIVNDMVVKFILSGGAQYLQ